MQMNFMQRVAKHLACNTNPFSEIALLAHARHFAAHCMTVLLLSSNQAAAQAPLTGPQGRFLKKTVLLGEPLDYELRYEHAPDLEVEMADETVVCGELLADQLRRARPREQVLVAQHELPVVERMLRQEFLGSGGRRVR